MANAVTETSGAKQISASTLVHTGGGMLLGIFCSSSTSGTCKVWDNTSAATTVLVDTFPLLAGVWYPTPFAFNTGLFVTIGGTASITVGFA